MLANPNRKPPRPAHAATSVLAPEDAEPDAPVRISKQLSLPIQVVTETIGVVAQRGAGKTYATNVLAEELIGLSLPVCILDPMGVYWGLLSSADGESEGLPVVILGGDHGHVQITSKSGKQVAEWVVRDRRPSVVDISHFRKNEQRQFVTDFAEELYILKAKHKEALHLILDEADLWAPQRPQPDQMRMLGAIEDLVRRGRARGIGLTLVTQRPAVISKDVLTQVSVLMALRITGPQDRKAVDDWIKYHGDEEQRERVLESIAQLPIGTAWFWSPGWLGILKKIQIRKRRTFDSSATPKPGEVRREPRTLATVDFAALAELFQPEAEPESEEKPAKGPKGKRGHKPSDTLPSPPSVPTLTDDRIPVQALGTALSERLGAALATLDAAFEAVAAARAAVQTAKDGVLSDLQPYGGPLVSVTPPGDRIREAGGSVLFDEKSKKEARERDKPRPLLDVCQKTIGCLRPIGHLGSCDAPSGTVRVKPSEMKGDGKLSKGDRKILAVLLTHGPCMKAKLAILAGYAVSSGTYATLLSSLRVRGYMEGLGKGPFSVTSMGKSAGVEVSPLPPPGPKRKEWWISWLPRMESRFVKELGAHGMTYSELVKRSGYPSAKSGSVATAISRLRVLGVAEGGRDAFRLTKEVIG
jgi:hypothetical protein